MAGYTLKLSIYTVTLRNNQKKDVNYKEFHKTVSAGDDSLSKQDLFTACKDKFLESFGEKFVLNYNNTKGIAVKEINTIPTKNLIDGMLIGGLTGIEQDVYNTSSPGKKGETISKDELTALPYYFKMWMPYDSQVGIIMIQSYTEAGVVALAMDKIKDFFRTYHFSIHTTPYVNKEYKDHFKKSCIIDELVLVKAHLSTDARRALNGFFADFSGLKIEIKVKGFNVSVENFWGKIDTNKPLDLDLSGFEMTGNNDYDVIATYKDESGKQSQARLSKNFEILPTIILDSTLKESGKEYADYMKIQKHTDAILKKVMIEIGYEAKDVE